MSFFRLGSLGAASLLLACTPDPSGFIDEVAQLDCKFERACSASNFMWRCATCRLDEDCTTGGCDQRTGRCRDAIGKAIAGGELGTPCQTSQQCGGFVCTTKTESVAACVETNVAKYGSSEEKCTFAEDVANECLRLLDERSCSASRPTLCNYVFFDCKK